MVAVPQSVNPSPSSMLTARWFPLMYYAPQQDYSRSPFRFNTLPAGRRSGKTELAMRKLVRYFLRGDHRWEDSRWFAAAPTRDQAKRIFWKHLKRLVPRRWVRKISEGELCITGYHGSELWVLGLDKPERLEGLGWNGGVVDEIGNVKERAWEENILPALTDRGGWCDFIGVPEGRNHYYFLDRDARAEMKRDPLDSLWGAYHWRSEEVMKLYGREVELNEAKRTMDPMTYEQEFGASFVNYRGRAYYAFVEETHATRLRDRYDPQQDLIFCFDFNVDPGVAVIAQEMPLPGTNDGEGHEQLGTGVIGEVHIENNSNTPAVCMQLLREWGDHQGRVLCYGDSTGGSGHSSQTEGSDWDIIRNRLRRHYGPRRVRMRYADSNPPVRNRINAMNSRLQTIDGSIRLMVDGGHAENVVTDLEGVLRKPDGTLDKKKNPDLSHLSDGLGYYIAQKFPVSDGERVTSKELVL